jgi:hypothetical protein
MSLLATLILLGFLAREVRFVVVARNEGAHPLWLFVGVLIAALYLIPLVAVRL